jgi:hypothetical protein
MAVKLNSAVSALFRRVVHYTYIIIIIIIKKQTTNFVALVGERILPT